MPQWQVSRSFLTSLLLHQRLLLKPYIYQAQDMNGNDITIPFTGRGIVHGLFTLLEKSDEFDFRQHFTGVPIQEPLDLTRHGLFNNSIWVNLAILVWHRSIHHPGGF